MTKAGARPFLHAGFAIFEGYTGPPANNEHASDLRPIAPSHGENRGSSPLGSATSFAQSFTFKTLVTRLCTKDAVFV